MDNKYYEILGVSENATQAEIKAAYRKASMANHPDRNLSDDQDEKVAEEKMKLINEAYGVLSEPAERTYYDKMGKKRDVVLENQARNTLSALFEQAMNVEDLAITDIVDVVLKSIEKQIGEMETGIVKDEVTLDELIVYREKMKSKEKDNIWHNLFDKKIDLTKTSIEGAKRDIDIGVCMKSILENYEFEFTKTLENDWPFGSTADYHQTIIIRNF